MLYEGEAVQLYVFLHIFRNQIRNLSPDLYEIKNILGIHCAGKPKKIVSQYEYSAFRADKEALDVIWKDLYGNRFFRN